MWHRAQATTLSRRRVNHPRVKKAIGASLLFGWIPTSIRDSIPPTICVFSKYRRSMGLLS
jgi:hypothetical protein